MYEIITGKEFLSGVIVGALLMKLSIIVMFGWPRWPRT